MNHRLLTNQPLTNKQLTGNTLYTFDTMGQFSVAGLKEPPSPQCALVVQNKGVCTLNQCAGLAIILMLENSSKSAQYVAIAIDLIMQPKRHHCCPCTIVTAVNQSLHVCCIGWMLLVCARKVFLSHISTTKTICWQTRCFEYDMMQLSVLACVFAGQSYTGKR